MIIQKNDVEGILEDIRAKYNRSTYSVQGLRRFTTLQYSAWEVDNVASDYKSILIGHFTINLSLLKFLNDQIVANASTALAINSLFVFLANAGGSVQEVNQIYNFQPGTGAIITGRQNEDIFVVSSSLRVATGAVLSGAWYPYDNATFTYDAFYVWLNNIRATMATWATPVDIEALISFIGYECVISN